MTWRVISNRPGMFAADHHDFRYHEAAEHYADILRDIGRQHVTIHQLPEGDRRE